MAGGAQAAGLVLNIIGGLMQKKPKVAPFVPVDLAKEQTEAIDANTSSLPALQALGSDINAFNQDELLKALRKVIPNYDDLVGKINKNIDTHLRGEIPTDVGNALQNSAAARAIGGGYGGSGMHRNLVARDFGRTSYDLTQRGFDMAQNWIQQSSRLVQPSMFDVTSMFVSPGQMATVQAANNAGQQAFQQQKNAINAAYSWQTIVGQSLSNFGGALSMSPPTNPGANVNASSPAPTSGGSNWNFGVGRTGGGSWFLGGQPGPG